MEGVQEPVFHMCDGIDFNAKTANDGMLVNNICIYMYIHMYVYNIYIC
jgi:hypothetical protein